MVEIHGLPGEVKRRIWNEHARDFVYVPFDADSGHAL